MVKSLTKATTITAEAGPGPRTRSHRAAKDKAKRVTAEQVLREDQPESLEVEQAGNQQRGKKKKKEDKQILMRNIEEHEEEDKDDDIDNVEPDMEEKGILLDAEGKRWLTPGEEFPWDQVEFYLDDSIGQDITNHLIKRIEKMNGDTVLGPEQADIILINPKSIKEDNLKRLTELGHIKEHLGRILSYNWLSKCYFTRKIELPLSQKSKPLFLSEETGYGIKVLVSKFDIDNGGESKRREIMIDLESNGAMIVGSWEQAEICIIPTSHPYNAKPPKEERFKHITWHTPGWIKEKIDQHQAEEKLQRESKKKKSTKIDENEDPKKRKAVNGKNSTKSKKAKVDVKRERHTSRTEFTPEDRDFLARWLAYYRPDKVGRTTKSLYVKLESYDRSHPFHEIASRHPSSAWHEHFKKSRSKIGIDGKVLEDQVDEYVNQGINSELTTKNERKKRDKNTNATQKLVSTSQNRSENIKSKGKQPENKRLARKVASNHYENASSSKHEGLDRRSQGQEDERSPSPDPGQGQQKSDNVNSDIDNHTDHQVTVEDDNHSNKDNDNSVIDEKENEDEISPNPNDQDLEEEEDDNEDEDDVSSSLVVDSAEQDQDLEPTSNDGIIPGKDNKGKNDETTGSNGVIVKKKEVKFSEAGAGEHQGQEDVNQRRSTRSRRT
ncbi:uncharacterized protein L201_007615 [Kwoniella dendrophila CBS 6074]|uniref:BRCT domain-containing protein n=1 Tax=Kwoniella dendrophila CBS 6074 TaxID=1295534 RepID=A0AAX4K4K6_9TREE